MRYIAAAAAASLAATVALAASAQADDIDYLMALDDQGIYYSDSLAVIDLGKITCSRLRNGMSPQHAPIPVMEAGYGVAETVIITYAAVHFMCTDQLATVQAYVNGEIPYQPPLKYAE